MKYKGWLSEVGSITLEDVINDLENNTKIGAITTFSGIVRDISDHDTQKVVNLEVEGWMEKGEEKMTQIAQEIGEKHNLLGVRIVHLTGMLSIGDPIVFVALSSIHRKEAFIAIEDAILAYKHKSPVWKKEIYEDGSSNWISTAKSELK